MEQDGAAVRGMCPSTHQTPLDQPIHQGSHVVAMHSQRIRQPLLGLGPLTTDHLHYRELAGGNPTPGQKFSEPLSHDRSHLRQQKRRGQPMLWIQRHSNHPNQYCHYQ